MAHPRALRAVAFAACSLPLAKLGVDAFSGGLGANPVEAILNRLGFWTLTLLVASLAATPAHDLLGLSWPVRVRRLVGLFAFTYATAHLVFYVAVDQVFDWRVLWADVTKRRFMVVGFTAWLALLPLAVTSTDRWVRRLGFTRWKRLHRLAYAAGALGVVHFLWRVKADRTRPLAFAAVLAGLFLARLPAAVARARRIRARAQPMAARPWPETATRGRGAPTST